jgi:tetratricopeptide (TPR) repeat protein
MRIHINTQKQRVVLQSGESLFPYSCPMKFQWFAFIAYMRKTQLQARGKQPVREPDEGWVTIADIQRLPLWREKTINNVGTNVGRYIRDMEDQGFNLVEAGTRWRGPYRLRLPAREIAFDVPVDKFVEEISPRRPDYARTRDSLLRFTEKYCRAESLFLQGWLVTMSRGRDRQKMLDAAGRRLAAWDEYCALARDDSFDASLRLLANLGAIRVMDRLGSFATVSARLRDCGALLKKVSDPGLVARYWITKARRDCRGTETSYQNALKAFAKAKGLSAKTRDLNLIGAIKDREGLLALAKTQRRIEKTKRPFNARDYTDYAQALTCLLEGLEARLLTENYDAIQASCFNIGNTLHRMGKQHLKEAEQWIRLSIDICKWMNLGRYEGISEIILAKIALESGDLPGFEHWIKKGESVAANVGNAVDLYTSHIVRALYYQRQDQRKEAIEHLAQARDLYMNLSEYDRKTQERYVRRKFSDLWDEVLKLSSKRPLTLL